MSIIFKSIKRRNPQNEDEEKYYAQTVMKGYYDLETIAEQISDVCTVTVHDVRGILSSLQQHIGEKLSMNQSVRLGQLGSFHVRTNCASVEDRSELSTDLVKCVKVHFVPSSGMHREINLDVVSFKKED